MVPGALAQHLQDQKWSQGVAKTSVVFVSCIHALMKKLMKSYSEHQITLVYAVLQAPSAILSPPGYSFGSCRQSAPLGW